MSEVRMVKLGDVVVCLDHLRKPVKESERTPGEVPYYGANGLQGTINTAIFNEPLVIVAEDGGHFEAPQRGVAYKIEGPAWVNNHGHVLRPSEDIDIDYLYYTLRNFNFMPYVSGSTRLKLNKGRLLEVKIPFPSLQEQRRIAEEYYLQDVIAKKRERQRELLGELKKSIFRDMFFNKNYVVKKLGEVAWTSSGSTPKRSVREYYDNGSIPWIKSGDLHKNYIFEASEFITEFALNETSAKLLEPGAILIAMYGATVGAVSELKISAATNQAVCAIIPKDENLDATYLKYFLISQYDYILGLAVGGAQANISQAIIKNLDIPIPSRQVQENFSEVMKTIDGVR